MGRSRFFSAVALALSFASAPALGEQPNTAPAPQAQAAQNPLADTLKAKLAEARAGDTAEDQKDFEALKAFYDARAHAPLWVADGKLGPRAGTAIAEFKNAWAYGLDPAAFTLREVGAGADLNRLAEAEIKLTQAALLYARHARGGRIMKPSEQLNSNLDRKPQLLDPKTILDSLAASDDAGAQLRATHPKHPQFEKLRQAYLEALGSKTGEAPVKLNPNAKRLRANMEMWRWMWDDLGEVHVFNNIPEFMQRVYKNGEVIRSEKIVAGMLDKQSSVFSRPLKHVVLRPAWRVPESIMVYELWPSLRRGGGLMRQYGLQIQTKDGKVLDWRQMDWSKEDIRNYIVMQPPGGKSVLGVVKFSFPSQHTIFMHDTPDKWMFRHTQRTLSHGCLRVQKPVELAEIMLREGNGWSREKMLQQMKSGPLNNEVEIEKKIPIHLAYFTAWVDDSGKLKQFYDVYGHERRVTQALDGDWDKIAKGRDHLAKPVPNFNQKGTGSATAEYQARQRKRRKLESTGGIISEVLGLGF